MLAVAACSVDSDTGSGAAPHDAALAEALVVDPIASPPVEPSTLASIVASAIMPEPTTTDAAQTSIAPEGPPPLTAQPSATPALDPSPKQAPAPAPVPVPELAPSPEVDAPLETQADESGEFVLAQADEYPIGTIPSKLAVAAEPGPLATVNPCTTLGPIGGYGQSQYVDMLGDGSADDLVTVHHEGWWKLRVEIAGGPTSEIHIAKSSLNPWWRLQEPVHFLEEVRHHIVVHEEEVGADETWMWFYGVDDDGCVEDGFRFLHGETGSSWHSLDCLGGATYASFTGVRMSETPGKWLLSSKSIHHDGSLSPTPVIEVSGDNELVQKRGQNNCD
jgi:hypothetical protein